MFQPTESKAEPIVYRENRKWPQWLAAATASLNFFTAGICFLWSSPSLAILQSEISPFPVSNSQASWIAAFLPMGCVIGPVFGSWSARHLGPKKATLLSAIPFIVGFTLIIFAENPQWLYASRFLCGFAVGFGQTASPIYIAEIAETKIRGALMSFLILSMGLGALFMTVLGPFFSISLMGVISLTFPILLLLLMNIFPESPYYLMRMQRENEAQHSLLWLRYQKHESFVKTELDEIKIMTSENMRIRDSLKLFFSEQNFKQIGIITLTFIGQSFCGAIVVMFFQEQLYDKAKVPIPAKIAVIITASISNVSGFLSLLFVDRWGRKPLLLISTFGCAVSTGMIGLYLHLDQTNSLNDLSNINWLPIIALNTLQVFFYFGLSPIPTTQLGEIFCSNVKEIAFCYGFIVAALSGVVITKMYQVIEDAFGLPWVFWALAFITIILFVLMIWIVPETKGKTFSEIQSSLFKKKDSLQELYVSTVSECYNIS